jgi:hypothetical protein
MTPHLSTLITGIRRDLSLSLHPINRLFSDTARRRRLATSPIPPHFIHHFAWQRRDALDLNQSRAGDFSYG